MRVALDATPLLGARTGVGRFTSELMAGLAGAVTVEPTAFALSWRGRGQLADELPDGVRLIDRALPAQPLRQAWMRMDVPRLEWLIGGDHELVHGTNFVGPPSDRPVVISVHDLTPVRFPELCTHDTLQYPTLIRRAVKRGAWIHTGSEFVRSEIIQHFPVDPDRVVVVPYGITPVGDGDAGAGRRIAQSDRYVLALGTVEPRKGLPGLVTAFDAAAADDEELALVIAGPDGWGADALTAAIDRSPHRARIRRLGFVSEQQRVDLLRGAATLAFPSVYEGFGLPPLEAMTAGTPVVTSDAGALIEVVRDGSLCVRVGDTDALARALVTATRDEGRRAELIAAGHRVASRYTWERMIDGVVDLYRRVLAS